MRKTTKKQATQQQSRMTSYLFLLINTITWGLALVIVKPSLEFTTPFRYLLYRYCIAAILSVPILLYYWPKVKNKLTAIKKVALVEFFGTGVALGLLYLGLAKTSAIEASFLTTTTPIFVVLAGIIFLQEKQEKNEWLGLLVAFAGTTLLAFFPVILNGMTPAGLSLEGNLLILFGNIATAIGMILAKKHYKNIPKFFATSIGFYFGIVVFLFLSIAELLFTAPASQVTGLDSTVIQHFIQVVIRDLSQTSVLFAAVYMALFGSIIGLTAYIKGQDGIEASEASLFWYLQPLVFVPAGVLFLQEEVHFLQIISMILIFIGVYIAEQRTTQEKITRQKLG